MSDIPEYTDPKTKCDWCQKPFRKNERVVVDSDQGLIFCDAQFMPNDCVVHWAMHNKKSVSATTHVFHGREQKLPEYGGLKSCCDGCGQPFQFGEVVWCDMSRQLIFCYSFDRGCVEYWKGDQPEAIVLPTMMRFHGNT